eukprot:RCo014838
MIIPRRACRLHGLFRMPRTASCLSPSPVSSSSSSSLLCLPTATRWVATVAPQSSCNLSPSPKAAPAFLSSPAPVARGSALDIRAPDYSRCTSEVYATSECKFTAAFEASRRELDYRFHSYYTLERQAMQDGIIQAALDEVAEKDLEHPCIVFTAGPMGSGKGHVLRYWHSRGVFPKERFVLSNPDHYRWLLPDFGGYLAFDEHTAGSKTKKESGMISELVTKEALRQRCNVIVDGSLHDLQWYSPFFANVHQNFPHYCIAILHIVASPEKIISRVERRGDLTGRHIPVDLLRWVIEQVPKSVKVLSQQAHALWEFDNDGGHDTTPRLINMECRVSPEKLGDLRGLHTLWQVEGHQRPFRTSRGF